MKNIIWILAVCISALAHAQIARPVVAQVCKVYTGYEGLMITTVRLGEESKNEALVKVSGIDHPWNNKVFKAKMNKYKSNSASNNFNIEYEIEWKGKKHKVLIGSGESVGLFTAYIIPFGSQQIEHRLNYDVGQSNYTSAERLLTEYLEQQ